MAPTNELTTLVCLFHHRDQANAALQDLLRAGVAQSSISVSDDTTYESAGLSWNDLGIPEADQSHLTEGLRAGGTLITVSAESSQSDRVEEIFKSNKAEKIDESERKNSVVGAVAGASTIASAGAATIPIVEEELVVGKRTVDQGGVRVYRRVVDIPVEQAINLREEHVNVARRAVDRAVTDGDLAFQGERTIELTETAEEAVVVKNARVVEEVRVGKEANMRTETIRGTVKKTEVEVEEIAPETARSRGNDKY